MTSPRLEIRALGRSGADRLVGMAAGEGWNPGLRDAETFFRIDPEAFLGVFQCDECAGGGAIARHSDRIGFMGLFIIRPELRGQGIGRKLWFERRNRLLERLGEGASIGLDGVTAMVPFYAAGGFVPAFVSHHFELTTALEPVEDPSIRPLAEFSPSAIEALDRRAFGGERSAYREAWLTQPGATVFGYGQSADQPEGFGVARPAQSGTKIGPLFALRPEVAKALFLALAAGVPTPVGMSVPSANPAALNLATSLGMEERFACTRMYFGPALPHETDLIYGLTCFELG